MIKRKTISEDGEKLYLTFNRGRSFVHFPFKKEFCLGYSIAFHKAHVRFGIDGPLKGCPLTDLKRYFVIDEPEFKPYITEYINVHENQYNTANEVLTYFEHGVRSVIITAEMQSGKTGTVRYVVYSLQYLTHGCRFNIYPESTFFICGMNDNDLRNQAIREFKGLIPEENILFSKQLQAINNDASYSFQCSLLIIDESHYASNKNSHIDMFIQGIRDQNPLTVSVSATAMAELATSEKMAKAVVYLEPGEDYYSIRDIFNRGLVFQSVNVAKMDEICPLICEEYEFQMEHADLKYNLIRLPSQFYNKDIEEELYNNYGLERIDFIQYHSQSDDTDETDFNNIVATTPKNFTIVWIYGSLRAGKQLVTTHLGFVHDTHASRPDTIAQSLLGRILGYGKRRDHVKCYTDLKSATDMREWMSSCYDLKKIPRGSKGILNGYSEQSKSKWNLHVPLLLHLGEELTNYVLCMRARYERSYTKYKQQLFDFLIELDESHKLETLFTTYQPAEKRGLMVLDNNNTELTFRSFWETLLDKALAEQPASGFHVTTPGNYFNVYINLRQFTRFYGSAIVIYKEYNPNGCSDITVHSKSRFSVSKAGEE